MPFGVMEIGCFIPTTKSPQNDLPQGASELTIKAGFKARKCGWRSLGGPPSHTFVCYLSRFFLNLKLFIHKALIGEL